jgi:2-polyprenyl-3-methyl-5-hydroxy-6-metoxy-1,4-benzoquinol methylase
MADQGSEGMFSPFLRKKRMEVAIPYININGRVLDVGCGIGLMANLISSLNNIVVDVDESSLNIAKQTYPKHQFLSQMPPSLEKFITIIALAVIEHWTTQDYSYPLSLKE